jgi:putative membrane protein
MMALWQRVIDIWVDLTWAVWMCVLAWVGATVSLPIVEAAWGDRALRRGVTAGVLLQDAAVIAILVSAWGWWRTGLVALAIVIMGWAVEYLGSRTGVPFGRYHYTDRLQPQLGHVPLLIPAAWLMMLPPAWAVATYITGGPGTGFSGLVCVVVSALAFTAWDLFLDPQMVAWRLWVWERPGGYFGIPWTNFAGWLLSAGVMTAVVLPLCPGPLPAAPLTGVYVLTWLLETAGLGVFWRQPGAALCGFLGMGGMLLWAWLVNR